MYAFKCAPVQIFLIASLVTLTLTNTVQDSSFPEEDNIIIINKSNIEACIRSFEHLVIAFYVPQSKSYQSFSYQFSYTASSLKDENSTLRLAKVNVAEEPGLAHQFKVTSYPTLWFYLYGKPMKYPGGNSKYELLQWAKSKMEPKSNTVDDPANFESTLVNNERVFVLWTDKDTREYFEYNQAASEEEFSELTFINTGFQELKDSYLQGDPARISVFKKDSDVREDFKGVPYQESIKQFIRDHMDPHIIEYDPKLSRKLFHGKHPTMLLIYNDSEDSKEALEALKKSAPKLKGKNYVVTVEISSEWGRKLLDIFGDSQRNAPVLAIIKPTEHGPIKYLLDEKYITIDSIFGFHQKFVENKLSAFYKSEEVDKTESGTIKTLNSKNFGKEVNKKNKHTLILYYTQYDRFLDKYNNALQDLTQKGKALTKLNLSLAKIDVSKNEFENFRVQKTPALYLHLGDGKKEIYKGSSDSNTIWKWTESQIKIVETEIKQQENVKVPEEPLQNSTLNVSEEEPVDNKKIVQEEDVTKPQRSQKEETTKNVKNKKLENTDL